MYVLFVLEYVTLLIHHEKKQMCQEVEDWYMCLNVKPLKIACNFFTSICDWIENYAYHGNSCTILEVMYVFLNFKLLKELYVHLVLKHVAQIKTVSTMAKISRASKF